MVCTKTIYVQKEPNPKKYGSATEIHVRMDNKEIRISRSNSYWCEPSLNVNLPSNLLLIYLTLCVANDKKSLRTLYKIRNLYKAILNIHVSAIFHSLIPTWYLTCFNYCQYFTLSTKAFFKTKVDLFLGGVRELDRR